MEQTDTISLTVPSKPHFLSLIRRLVAYLAEEAGFPEADVNKMVLAVDEACSNVIKHAYQGDENQVIIVNVCRGNGKFELVIRDFGKTPDLEKIKPRALDDVRPGGLGTHFIRSVMDEVRYDTSAAVGTSLHLVKYLPR